MKARWARHLGDARRRPTSALHHAIRKYGPESFRLRVLEYGMGWGMLCAREVFWIAKLGTLAPGGYNLTAGGEGVFGHRPSDETRRKMSAAALGRPKSAAMRTRMREVALARPPEHLAKIAEAHRGKTLSTETRAKLREARSRQVFSPEVIEARTRKLRGRRHTEQARANMSAAQKGRPKTPECREKIRASLRKLTPTQAAIIKFDALGLRQCDYARRFGVSPQMVNGIVKGRAYPEVTRDDLPREIPGESAGGTPGGPTPDGDRGPEPEGSRVPDSGLGILGASDAVDAPGRLDDLVNPGGAGLGEKCDRRQ